MTLIFGVYNSKCLYILKYMFSIFSYNRITVYLQRLLRAKVSLCVQWSRAERKCWIFIKRTFFLTAVAPPSSAIGLKNKRTVGDQTQNQNNDLWLVVAEEEDEISLLNVFLLS